jgi:lysyl-tRNA synthetase class 2
VDKTHNPEFTMMECYSTYDDYEDVMKLTEEMVEYIVKKVNGSTKVKYQGKTIDFKAPWKRIPMKKAIKTHLKIDVDELDDKKLKEVLKKNKIEYEGDFSRGLAIQLIFEELVEDKLIQPTFVIDHPKESTPLCKKKRGDKELIERFEVFINGWEFANAYSELNDPILQKKLLEEQEEKGRGGDEEAHPMDEDFIRSLEYGMPPTGGLGIGVDRLVMLLTNAESIRDVILFPMMRPEK